MNIPHSSPWITSEDIDFVNQRMETGLLAHGSMVSKLEEECGKYLGQKYSIATTSGKAALIIALKSLNIKDGDEVILPSYCCHSVEDAVLSIKAKPVFCDIGENWCMTSHTVSKAITPKTKTIIAVHMFGIQCDIKSICALGVPVIEDCCQYFCKDAGKFGQISVFSFHATKCLTTGEGGMVTSNKPLNVYDNAYTMSDLQASLGVAQIKRYDEILQKRVSIANFYNKEIDLPYADRMRELNNKSIYFRYPLTVENGYKETALKFENKGISVRRGVDTLLHQNHNIPDNLFPNTIDTFNKTVSIPIYPSLNTEEIGTIVDVTKRILS